MTPEMKNEILISYFQSKEKYDKLAYEIRRLFEIDPDFPKESVYTIKHRLKKDERLIEKIDNITTATHIDSKNYQEHINDLLGMRIVCLRHSDVKRIEEYLTSLKEEEKLIFVREPEKKLPPYLWIPNPEEGVPEGEIQYSGYSSVHYVVKLGPNLGLPTDISSLHCEIQVRTILEEAWGEIDHRYRYEITRKGTDIPSAIDRGFRAFSAYLQAATIQVEYLCRDVESFLSECSKVSKSTVPSVSEPKPADTEKIETVLKTKVGFIPTERTLKYVERRMSEAGFYENLPLVLKEKVFTEKALNVFNQVYKGIMKKEPFQDSTDRDIDLLNILNFSLFRLIQLEEVAVENLKSILLGRIR